MSKESSGVRAERVREWLLSEKVTIGLAVAFLVISVVGALVIIINEGTEGLIARLADLQDLVFGVPLGSLLALLGLRWQRLKAEKWIADNAPLLQDEPCLDMDSQCRPKWFRLPLPKWVDFDKTVLPRMELKLLRDSVEQAPFTMLLAKSGAGKTTLALHLGYLLLTEKGRWEYLVDSAAEALESAKGNPASAVRPRRLFRLARRFAQVLLTKRAKWRFAMYWDMHDGVDPSDMISEIHDRMNGRSLEGCRVLLILDNVHLAEDFVNKTLKYHRNLFGKGLSCLFLARVTSDSIEQDRKKWDRALGLSHDKDTTEPQGSPVKYLFLGKEDFGRTVEGITRLYAKKSGYRLPSDEKESSRLFAVLREKCEESLILLKFLLGNLRGRVNDIREVEGVDVADAVGEYYDEHVINAIEQTIKETKDPEMVMSNSEILKQNIRKVLLCVSLYSQLELPTYRPLVFNVLGVGSENKVQVSRILGLLLSNGDLVGEWDRFSHPHLTIARVLPEVYHKEFEALRCDFERVLSSATEGLIWPDEYAVVAAHRRLADDGKPDDAAQYLARLLETTSGESTGLLEYLVLHESELGLSLSMTDPHYWLVGRIRRFLKAVEAQSRPAFVVAVTEAIRRSEEAWWFLPALSDWPELAQEKEFVAVVAGVIRNSTRPWDVVGSISRWSGLQQNREVMDAVVDSIPKITHAICTSHVPRVIVRSISSWPELKRNSDIAASLVVAIRSSGKPWNIIGAISDWSELKQNADVMAAITDSIPKIVHGIHSSTTLWRVIDEIRDWPELRANKDVMAAVIDSIPRIAHAIRSSEKPRWVVHIVSEWPELRHNDEVLNAIAIAIRTSRQSARVINEVLDCTEFRHNEDLLGAVISTLHNSLEPHRIIRSIGRWPELKRRREIAAEILSAVRSSEKPWAILEGITDWPELRQNQELVAAVVSALRGSQEPWNIMHAIRDWLELRENKEVMAAVTDSVPKIVHAIHNSDKPWTIIVRIRYWSDVARTKEVLMAVEDSIPLIARVILDSDEPWVVMNSIRYWPQLTLNEEIAAAVSVSLPKIVNEIRSSDPPFPVISVISDWPGLRQKQQVMDALADSIRDSEVPWDILGAIQDWFHVRQDTQVMTAVADSTPRIARAIRNSKIPWVILVMVRLWPEITRTKEFMAAVIDSIPTFARAIHNSEMPWNVMGSIPDWPELRQNKELTAAVTESIPRLTLAIRNSEKPWYIISEICDWSEVTQNEQVTAAVTDSIPRIAHEIRNSHEPLTVIDSIQDWPGIRQNGEVLAAIAQAIAKSDKPWLVIVMIRDWPQLGEDRSLRNAVDNAIPSIADWIVKKRGASPISELIKVGIVRDSIPVQEALKSVGLYEQYYGLARKAEGERRTDT